MIGAWIDNVGRNWRWVWNREYVYYYCSLWCFLTDQHLCRKTYKKHK